MQEWGYAAEARDLFTKAIERLQMLTARHAGMVSAGLRVWLQLRRSGRESRQLLAGPLCCEQPRIGRQVDPKTSGIGQLRHQDGEAIEIAQRASASDPEATTVVELGGGGLILDRDYRVNDVPVRGFWSYYAELMGIEPEGAVR